MNTGSEKQRTGRTLTDDQYRALVVIREHIREHSLSPSLDELAAALEIGKTTAKTWVDWLRDAGCISLAPGRYRNLIVTDVGHRVAEHFLSISPRKPKRLPAATAAACP